jgi:hypothetical protein
VDKAIAPVEKVSNELRQIELPPALQFAPWLWVLLSSYKTATIVHGLVHSSACLLPCIFFLASSLLLPIVIVVAILIPRLGNGEQMKLKQLFLIFASSIKLQKN